MCPQRELSLAPLFIGSENFTASTERKVEVVASYWYVQQVVVRASGLNLYCKV
jgi:hypothetical protein